MFTEKQKIRAIELFVGIKRKAAGQPAVVYSSRDRQACSKNRLAVQ
ncbi:hypothetical protein [Klebsiella pneumoniae]|nr:hypothetical protein [Klebsiella pneumoniae]UPG28324.1 hypothetical protein J4W55_000215 [Escherichia coli]